MSFEDISKNFTLIHGPCSIESYQQMEEVVDSLKGISMNFRGGVYKPRTSPDSFQGLKAEGIEIIEKIKKKHPEITMTVEITDIRQLQNIECIDIIQIGARNMQNFELITEIAKTGKPILLKRGFGNTVDELISSMRYIEKQGNYKIILCERGIRTFSDSGRFTLDLSAVGELQNKVKYPIFVDPSHAGGEREEVKRLCAAAIAYGCDGIIIEVHPDPENAQSDNNQQLNIKEYQKFIDALNIRKNLYGEI